MPIYPFRDPATGVITEVEITDEQETELKERGWTTGTSPELPDEIRIEPDGQLVERERARPPEQKPDS